MTKCLLTEGIRIHKESISGGSTQCRNIRSCAYRGNLHCSSTDFENPKVVNKMFGIFQGTAFIAGSAQQVD